MSEKGGKDGKDPKKAKDVKSKEPEIQNIWVGRQMSETFILPLFLVF